MVISPATHNLIAVYYTGSNMNFAGDILMKGQLFCIFIFTTTGPDQVFPLIGSRVCSYNDVLSVVVR
jgi:hypothetical protein